MQSKDPENPQAAQRKGWGREKQRRDKKGKGKAEEGGQELERPRVAGTREPGKVEGTEAQPLWRYVSNHQ